MQVERVREKLVQEGLEPALNRAKPIRVKSRIIDADKGAYLLTLVCGDGDALKNAVFGQRLVEPGHVESEPHETIRKILRK